MTRNLYEYGRHRGVGGTIQSGLIDAGGMRIGIGRFNRGRFIGSARE